MLFQYFLQLFVRYFASKIIVCQTIFGLIFPNFNVLSSSSINPQTFCFRWALSTIFQRRKIETQIFTVFQTLFQYFYKLFFRYFIQKLVDFNNIENISICCQIIFFPIFANVNMLSSSSINPQSLCFRWALKYTVFQDFA